MMKNVQNALQTLENNLNSDKTNVQCTLFDLANLKQGERFARHEWKSTSENEWQTAVENIMSRIANIIPADEAYCECDTYSDPNGMMDLVNHSSNFAFYVNDKYVMTDKTPRAISKQSASKIIDYVSKHLDDIKDFVDNERETNKVLVK